VAEHAVAESPTAPNARWILASNYYCVAQALEKLRRRQEAIPEYDTAADLFRGLAAEFPAEPNYAANVLAMQMHRMRLLVETGAFTEALAAYDTLLKMHPQKEVIQN